MTHKKFIGAVLTTTAGLIISAPAQAEFSLGFGFNFPFDQPRTRIVRKVRIVETPRHFMLHEIHLLEDEVNNLERELARTKTDLNRAEDQNDRLARENKELKAKIEALEKSAKTGGSWFGA
jgi:hypothetical protein